MICVTMLCVASETSAQSTPGPKNVVLIMLDDADYFDFGFTQNRGVEKDAVTPNMNALRRSGRLFTQFRTASAVCSPTRISVLTGRNPVRFGAINAWFSTLSESGLSDKIPQLGSMMQLAGKKTGFFGKWHVGSSRPEFQPGALGFDRHCRYTRKLAGRRDSWDGRYRFVSESGFEDHDVEFVDRFLADEALSFIDECHSAKEDFFVAYFPYTPHYPWSPPSNYVNRFGFSPAVPRDRMLAMMDAIDREVGRIVTRLRIRGLLDDTIIMLTSDNGGVRRVQSGTGTLRGSKATLLDGGLRVPLLASWKGQIPANSTNDSFLMSYDILPTLADLTGLDVDAVHARSDGRSFKEALKQNVQRPNLPAYWELSGGSFRSEEDRWARTQAYQQGDMKLVRFAGLSFDHPIGCQLFDLRNDPEEKADLCRDPQFQKVRDSMRVRMQRARKRISNYGAFPDFASEPIALRYDPKLDVNERDMTLQFDLLIPDRLRDSTDLYYQPGAQRLRLTKAGLLTWRVNGYDAAGDFGSIFMTSKRLLKPGQVYRVVLSIGGFRRDQSKIEMFVDGEKQDDGDDHFPSLFRLRGTNVPSQFGSHDVVVDRAAYSTLRLWPDEWE